MEGGLVYLKNSGGELKNYAKYKTKYKDFLIEKRISPDEYIKKTKRSLCVFNAPSVGLCHGWKLAEYLCMGKAIISMPLTREMPGEGLVHGKNVHFVTSTEEIYDAVIRIKNDTTYRVKLEKGARDYYEKWLAPEMVVKRLISSTL